MLQPQDRNSSAGVAEDEAYVWEARERSGEQKAEDATVRVLREFEQRGRNPAERSAACLVKVSQMAELLELRIQQIEEPWRGGLPPSAPHLGP